MPKKITNFELRDAEKGRVIRQGDNALLSKDGKYYVSNDDGEWKQVYVRDLDAPDETGDTPDDQPVDTTNEGTGSSSGAGTASGEGSGSVPAKPKTADINNQGELESAIQNPGDYTVAAMPGELYQLSNSVSSGIRLTAHDPNAIRPMFGSHSLIDKQNMTFDGLGFEYRPQPGQKISHPHLNHSNCTNIDYIRALVIGPLWNDTGDTSQEMYNWGEGIQAHGCNGLYIGLSKFRGFSKAIQPNRVANLEVIRNDIGFFGSDGFSHFNIWDSLFEENYIHHCVNQKPGAHGDMGQGFGEQQRVRYVRNFCDRGGTLYTQGLHNKTQTIKRLVEFIENVLILSHTNGHTGGGWEQSLIRGEIMVRAKNNFAEAHEPNGLGGDSLRGLWEPKIRVDGDIRIENSTAPDILKNGVRHTGVNGNVRDQGDEDAVRKMARARLPFFDYSGA